MSAMHNYNSILYIANLAAIEKQHYGPSGEELEFHSSNVSKLQAKNRLFKADKFKCN